MAGERLSLQLKELDAAYVKHNKREFELTKSVSVKMLDAKALIELMKEGKCTLELPDWLFDMDFPDTSLYAMRIKSVAVSLPCVTGPHVSTNLKLKIEKSEIDWLGDGTITNNDKIEEVITSTAVNDVSVFEAGYRNERYMPFENHGVISTWNISLPKTQEFDYSTISDVVLHIQYVAKGKSVIASPPSNTPTQYKFQMMSWKHDFPLEWHKLHEDLTSSFDLTLGSELIPYKVRALGKTKGILILSDSIPPDSNEPQPEMYFLTPS